MNKKITAVVSILVLMMTTTGATIVSAQGLQTLEKDGFFTSLFLRRDAPSIDEIIDTYEDLKLEKQELRQLLESYGIELPDLSSSEKRQLIKTVRNLRRAGNSREEIKMEIIDLLLDFGVQLPDLTKDQRAEIRMKTRTHLETTYGYVFVELTPEQKAYLKQTFIQLKKEGKTQEEIRTELITLYEEYGGVIPELSESEKEDIHDWFITMAEEDYDVDLPDLTFDQRKEIKNQKDEIHSLQKELRLQLRHTNWLNRFRFFRYVRNNGIE